MLYTKKKKKVHIHDFPSSVFRMPNVCHKLENKENNIFILDIKRVRIYLCNGVDDMLCV